MTSGRELDKLIDQYVIGGTYNAATQCSHGYGCLEHGTFLHYSTDIAAAWKVVEKLQWAEPELRWSDEQHQWTCHFWKAKDQEPLIGAATAPHAICLAALKATEVRNIFGEEK